MSAAAAPELSGEALAAARHRGSHLQIIAAAGSGKTEVVSQRVAMLLAEGVPPEAIVAFTFTERAASELKARIATRVAQLAPGNLIDRLIPSRRHVVDFLYFHLHPRGGGEAGFPAFNVADVAICTGVGLMLLLGFVMHETPPAPASKPASASPAEVGAPGVPTEKSAE